MPKNFNSPVIYNMSKIVFCINILILAKILKSNIHSTIGEKVSPQT